MYKYKRNKERFTKLYLILFLIIIGIGYSLLQGELRINGDTLFRDVTWDIHFGTPTITEGSVSGIDVTTGATVTGTNSDTIEYSVTFAKPKDFYEFVVPVVNNSSVDAMIDSVTNKIYSGNEEIEKPEYVGYKILYENGAAVREKQLLPVNTTKNIKVKVYYKENVDYPETATPLLFRFNINYRQADNTAIGIETPTFDELSSWEMIIDGIREGSFVPNVGDTKMVDLGTLGTHVLRVANVSTPEECATHGFSQTACGLVLEFADCTITHNMNSSSTNIGGWPATSLHTYVNNDIYNAIPEVIREAIIDTLVVSGHGPYSGELNFVSTDKLYLLSGKEVGFNNNYDTVKTETRVLDYYNTNNNDKSRIKSNNCWWLRSADFGDDDEYNVVHSSGSFSNYHTNSIYGVAPAFRIK